MSTELNTRIHTAKGGCIHTAQWVGKVPICTICNSYPVWSIPDYVGDKAATLDALIGMIREANGLQVLGVLGLMKGNLDRIIPLIWTAWCEYMENRKGE